MEKLSIKRRRIIPIRAIPEVTGRQCPPDDLARILAGTAPKWRPSVELQAYHLDSTGDYFPVPPRDWDTVVQDLAALEHKLRADQEVEDENHPLWRKQAAETIPSATFAWWDEFEAMIYQLFPPHMDERLAQAGYRSGLHVINEHPMLQEDLADLVYQGFESLRAHVPEALPTKSASRKRDKVDRDAFLCAEAKKMRRSELHADKSDTWIAKQLAKDKTINTQKLTPETIRQILRKK